MTRAGLLAAVAAVALLSGNAAAQTVTTIIPDTAPALTTNTGAVQQGAVTFIIGGELRGANLFHSFNQFSLGQNELAVWLRTQGDGAGISNVINRVTGGVPSFIQGTLQTSGMPNASFFFINPAGIVFGPGASVNVPNSAHFSTAQAVGFADGALWTIGTPGGSQMTSAPLQAFGFLGGQNNLIVQGVGPGFVPGTTRLSLSGADVGIASSQFAAAGIQVAAVGNAQTFLSAGNVAAGRVGNGTLAVEDSIVVSYATPTQPGHASLAGSTVVIQGNGSVVRASPNGPGVGGDLTVSADVLELGSGASLQVLGGPDAPAGTLRMDAALMSLLPGSLIRTDSNGGGGGDIRIAANELRAGGEISTFSATEAAAGNIQLAVRDLLILGELSAIGTRTTGPGAGGNIAISGGDVVAASRAIISSLSSGPNSGSAGSVDLDVRSLTMSGRSVISSSTVGAGNAGPIRINAGAVSLDEAAIFSVTSGSGDSGAVSINVSGAMTLRNIAYVSTEANQGSSGNAGALTITAGQLSLIDGGRIDSSSFGEGNAGNVTIAAQDILVAGVLDPADPKSRSSIQSLSGGNGNAGSIRITGGTLTLERFGVVRSDTFSPLGRAGDISIEVSSLTGSGGAGVSSSSFGGGRGGAITVRADQVSLDTGAVLASDASGAGDAGSVTVEADELTLRNSARISTFTGGTGAAGLVRLDVGQLTMVDAGVSSSTFGPGDAGNVSVTAIDALVDGSAITSEVMGGTGNAGQVTVNADRLMVTNFGRISSSVLSPTGGHAGTVSVNGGEVHLDQGGVIASSSQGGNAGLVSVNAERVRVGADSFITSDVLPTSAGNAGTVSVTADVLELDDGEVHEDGSFTPGGKITSTTGTTGNSGVVQVVAGRLIMGSLTTISSETGAVGNAGSVTVTAGELQMAPLSLINSGARAGSSGNGGAVDVRAGTLTMNGGAIRSETLGSGDAGIVTIAADDLRATNGSEISSSSTICGDNSCPAATGDAGSVIIDAGAITLDASIISSLTFGSGNAGSISIAADSLDIARGGRILSSQGNDRATGNAGAIDLRLGRLTIGPAPDSRLSISTSIFNTGQAGSVTIDADEVVLIGGSIGSSANGRVSGRSGDVSIRAGSLSLGDGARIETESLTPDPAGSIQIAVDSLTVGMGSRIISENLSTQGGAAGLITIEGRDVSLLDGGIISTNSLAGAAGDIVILMPEDGTLLLRSAGPPSQITTSSGPGTGGRIIISNPYLILSHGGSILALGEQGGANVQIESQFFIRSADRLNLLSVDGSLVLDSQVGDLSTGTELQDVSFLDASSVLAGRCMAARRGETSQFSSTVTGPYAPLAVPPPADPAGTPRGTAGPSGSGSSC